jgi:hypothetical protein
MQDNRPRWADNFAATLIVTPVLPATATTGVLLFPEQVTVVARGCGVAALRRRRRSKDCE